MTVDRQQIIRQLRTEIAALEQRLSSQNSLIGSLREQLSAHEDFTADERRTQVFRRAARDIVEDPGVGEFGAEAPLLVKDMGDALEALGGRLDHKFAEIRALSEITEDINSGVFFDEVLDHVFDSFEKLIPYDRIGVALIEKGASGDDWVRAQWSRAKYDAVGLGKGFRAKLAGSSLEGVAQSHMPRILNDLEAYLKRHPDSTSTKAILKEGVRSSLTCPLIARDQAIGFIFFSSREPHTYDDQHVELFLQIAGELALTLEKSKAYEELYLRNEFIKKVFGLPTPRGDDAERAVACAIEMQNVMGRINEYNLGHGLPDLETGIGLNTGDVVAGNIGSEKRMKFSVIGSPVNIASRIQGLASGGQIFASHDTIGAAGPQVETAGNLNVKIKGVEDPVPVYEITAIGGAHARRKV